MTWLQCFLTAREERRLWLLPFPSFSSSGGTCDHVYTIVYYTHKKLIQALFHSTPQFSLALLSNS